MTKTDTAERSIVTSRVFDAPRSLVWQAWTDPQHVGHWWGPTGFTNTVHHMEVRPGGTWLLTMHGPDGRDWPNLISYLEVDEPARLVYLHGEPDGDPNQAFHVTVTFTEQAGKTEVTMVALFASKEARDFVVREVGAIEGAQQHLARLAAYLPTMGAAA